MSFKSINITLGTAGHIDHGKTALIRNLTGCETDRLKEEKERGMSIELGFAPCQLGELQVGIVDVPGHENFIRTMVAGASGMDGVIFVVAADDGPMPQTREHLDILTLLDVHHGVVALTKIDRVSPEELELAKGVLKDFLRGTFLETAPVIPVSNVNGEGFGNLYGALQAMVGRMPARAVDGVFRLPVERTFSVKGYGTVVTGVPLSGSVRLDDEIVLLPQGITGRIKTLQVYGRDSDVALAGQCAAINVRHWDHQLINRGDTVTVPGYFEPQSWCVCRLQLLPHERLFLKNGATVKFHTGTSERVARVYLLEGEQLPAGASALVQVRFEEPAVAGPRDRFIIRTLSPVQTIGGGMIVETLAGRLKRNHPEVRQELGERAAAVEQEPSFVEYAVRRAEGAIASEVDLARRVKLPAERVRAIVADLQRAGRVLGAPGGWMHRQVADALGDCVLGAMASYHRDTPESPGLTADLLRQAVACPREALDAIVAMLKERGRVVERNQRLALSEHQACFQSEDARLSEQIEGLFRDRAFDPPDVEELPALLGVPLDKGRSLVRLLVEHGRLLRLPEGIFFHREAIDRAREILVEFIRKEGRLESVRFKYLLDTSRKFAIPLLDYFDRTGVTRRAHNTRYLKAPYTREA